MSMLLRASPARKQSALTRRVIAFCLAFAATLVCGGKPLFAKEFPYMAYVSAPEAYVRSGPGEEYYAVAKLNRMHVVEVYRHDRGGWYAIRPPADSFSWVSAEFVEPRQGNLGVVTGENVVARIGSSFSDERDVIQVRLDRGEEVEILEAREVDSGATTQTWYKISPPAGEFRWILGKHLNREPAEPGLSDHDGEHRLVSARQNRHRTHDALDREVDRRPSTARRHGDEFTDDDLPQGWNEEADDDVSAAEDDEPLPKMKHVEPKRRPKPATEPDVDELTDTADAVAINEARPARLKAANRQPKADLKEEAEDLDLALSLMAIEETTEWDLTVLRRQAESALNRAETALDRGRIRRVLNKIDKFADIQERSLAVDMRKLRLPQNLASLDRSTSPTGPSPLRYDGVGRLTQLSTYDPRLPQFALLNTQGQVAAYVTPAPGVNLRRYLNQDVGINGTLGFLPERQAQHLTAKRIVPVESSQLR